MRQCNPRARSPAAESLPRRDRRVVAQHVVFGVLCRRRARVIRQEAQARAHRIAREVDRSAIAARDDAVLLVGIDDDEVVLSACPCPLVAPSRPEVLCGLAASVIEGMLSATGSRLRLVDTRHDPQRRLCAARL